jgi:hypothetical protein
MSSILKTDQLIKTIKRRGFLPSSQETFLDEDFLEMATEEVNLGLVPLIQRMHEEHLVYFEDIIIVEGNQRYPIPPRAHGNKLRDVFLVDANNNAYDMQRYSVGDIADFSNNTSYGNSRGFYLENNDIVLSGFDTSPNQKLRVYFYMRPNTLVKVDRGATVISKSTGTQIDYLNSKSGSVSNISVATQTVITSTSHNLSGGDSVTITGSDSTPSIDGTFLVNVIDSNSFSIPTPVTVAGTTGSWVKVILVNSFSFSKTPKVFSGATLFDIVQHTSPNKILYYNIPVNFLDSNLNNISFPVSLSPSVSVGDYITLAEETIVPNIPTELHPLLAQRVAVACLEAMGDEQNKQSAERKLKEMEMNANTFLDNRVEGAQIKIKSKNSPLVGTLNTLGRRNRRW